MRRSLESYLEATLRLTKGVELRPEQNVDETKPVDLKVTFTHANRRALIEIKWMGDSAPRPGETGAHHKFRTRAATDGAKQLANYLDLDKPRSTEQIVTGYLVVFDARRGGLKLDTTEIDSKHGMQYEQQEIDFDPKILSRPDFAPPRRMFMEPVCQG